MRRFVYATNMGLLYRLTPTKWAAFKAASLKDEWADIDQYGDLLGTAHNVTDWTATDFQDAP